MASPQLVNGVLVEQVGHDAVVVIPGRLEAIRLTGEPAAALLSIQSGQLGNFSSDTVQQLVALGVVDIPGLSRRGLINAGVVGAGAGIVALAMPSVAAASSGPGGGGSSTSFPVLPLSVKSFAQTASSPRIWTFTFQGAPNVFSSDSPPRIRFDGFAYSNEGFAVQDMPETDDSKAIFLLRTDPVLNSSISSELDTFLSNIAVGSAIPDGTVRILSEGVLYVVIDVRRTADVS